MSRNKLSQETFWGRVATGAQVECWIWKGPPKRSGYGQLGGGMFGDSSTTIAAHRAAWAIARNNGELLPAEIEVHHLCFEPLCCNPDHLEALPREEHLEIHRGCRQHGFEEMRRRGGRLRCAICDREKQKDRYWGKKIEGRKVLTCTCGTWWDKMAIDEFNEGRVERAMERHLEMWRFDQNLHLFSAA